MDVVDRAQPPQGVDPGQPAPNAGMSSHIQRLPGPRNVRSMRMNTQESRGRLSKLTEKDRELLWLREVEGLAYGEIGGRFGAATGTIRVACHRARKKARTGLPEGGRLMFRMFHRDREDGASLVEFAVVLPLLILLVFGIMEAGWLFAQQVEIRNAAREGARLAVVDFPDPGDSARSSRRRAHGRCSRPSGRLCTSLRTTPAPTAHQPS